MTGIFDKIEKINFQAAHCENGLLPASLPAVRSESRCQNHWRSTPAPCDIPSDDERIRASGCRHGTLRFQSVMIVNSLTSVSLDPRAILVRLRAGSGAPGAVRSRERFGLNSSSSTQTHLSQQFCGPIEARSDGAGLLHDECAILSIGGAVAHLRCKQLKDVHTSGDHEIFFDRIQHCASTDGMPLICDRGRLHSAIKAEKNH